MNRHLFASIVAAAFVVSCAQDNLVPESAVTVGYGTISYNTSHTVTITADSEGPAETKTSLSDNYSVLWGADDAFNVMGNVLKAAESEVSYEVSTNYSAYQTYALTNSYDGDESTYFWSSSAQATGKYIEIKFSTIVRLTSFSTYSSSSTDMPASIEYLQVSADGSSWTDIGAFSGEQRCTFSDIDSGVISYVRIYAKSSVNYWLVLNEMTMEVTPVSDGSLIAVNEKFSVTSGVGETSASFTGTINGEQGDNTLYALYPYSESATFDDSAINFELPYSQNYAEGTFDHGANPSVGALIDGSVEFKNLCGVLKLPIKGSVKVTSITVSDNAGKSLWGSVSYPVASIGEAAEVTGGSSSIDLVCPDGVQLNETTSTPFYIVVPAGAFAEGLTVVVDTDAGKCTVSTDKDNTIHRSKIRVMPAFTLKDFVEPNYWDQGTEIEIADSYFSKESTGYSSVEYKTDATVDDASLKNKAVLLGEGVTLTLGSNASIGNTIFICASTEGVAGAALSSVSSVQSTGLVALKNIEVSSGLSFKGSSLSSLYMDDSEVALGSSAGSLVDLSSNGSDMTQIAVVDNVFHSTAAATPRTYSVVSGGTSRAVGTMVLKDNMFMNVTGNSGSLASFASVGNLTLERNHFFYGSSYSGDFAILNSTSTPSGNVLIDSNTYYPAGGAGTVSVTSSRAACKLDSTPFSSVNVANGTYTLLSPSIAPYYESDEEISACTIDGSSVSFLHLPTAGSLGLFVMPGMSYEFSGTSSVTVNGPSGSKTYTTSYPDLVSSSSVQSLNSDNTGWRLVWSDEFTQSDWDRGVWTRCPTSTPDWAKEQWPDDESLVEMSDGVLVTWGKKDSDTSKGNGGYICGGIWGKDLKSFNLGMNGVVGRIDIRARMTYATGYWPAIWMMPQQDSFTWPQWGEIDIMEHLNSSSGYYATLHTSRSGGSSGTDNSCNNGGNASMSENTWHVFSVIVINNEIRLLIDGKTSHTCKKSDHADTSQTSIDYWMNYWPFDQTEYYMIMDSQLNGGWVGNATGANLPAHMDIDYVRYMVKE